MKKFDHKSLELFAIYKIKIGGNVHFSSDDISFFPGKNIAFMVLQKNIQSPYHIHLRNKHFKVLNLNDNSFYYMYLFLREQGWKQDLELIAK